MRSPRPSNAHVLLLIVVVAVAGISNSRAAEALTEPGPPVVAGENDQEWRPLFSALAAQAPLHATFSEHRWFPFRSRPVDLTGELRFSNEHGLSLHYLEPQVRTMIVDEGGILLRDARGRSRAVPSDHRTVAANAALLSVLRADLDELLDAFEVRAARMTDDWRFDLEPREELPGRAIDQITVWGRGETVQRLEIRRASNQRVEIVITESKAGATFTAGELAAFFR